MKTIAVDVGATYIRFGLVQNGAILRRLIYRTPASKNGLATIFGQAFKILHQTGATTKTAVGIASIGPLSVRRGVIQRPPNLGLAEVNLREIVERFHRA
ncbi:MAG: ROK family protein, partial [Candidatus Caldarchaeum sp.]